MKEEERVTIYCAGGCGRSVTLRRSRVNPADFYLCNSRADGQRCRDSLPPVPEGKGSFGGETRRDCPGQPPEAAGARDSSAGTPDNSWWEEISEVGHAV